MLKMKTPGVYIVEKSAFANSVVEVATAVPAFVGYTERAERGGNESLLNKPTRISSIGEYHSLFGGAPAPVYKIVEASNSAKGVTIGNTGYKLSFTSSRYTLYYNLMLFFANGGGPCYIVSVGDYSQKIAVAPLQAGIEQLKREQEPTMLVIPEAVNLSKDDCAGLQKAMLMHCGYEMKNRVALLDIFPAEKDPIKGFREEIGSEFLSYGAAYYPWLNTSIVGDQFISEQTLVFDENLKNFLKKDVAGWNDEEIKSLLEKIGAKPTDKTQKADAKAATPLDEKVSSSGKTLTEENRKYLHVVLMQNAPSYKMVFEMIKQDLNVLPPSAALAGIYTMVDNSRGVWKAPANVSIANVVSPAIQISNEEQEDLNTPLSGKAVNAIRSFSGEGVKVWGARTLDGNSLDYRYINVRRTLIYLEESVKNAVRAYMFDPNTANTWLNVKCMIDNFLRNVWKKGGLAGSTPEEAFNVQIGLGSTMTPEDILEGIMRITVLVSVSRPAEFIEITFQQQMQES
ncbi:phage tail sheath subtilisin-like domain-containing protein [Bacteroidales bacterium OttesenSCG-928-A17]|nr:phage tail sheath subtilisin-like domain-containing protein [Bacteroidales bacterium OttesenSCG-928-A17]